MLIAGAICSVEGIRALPRSCRGMPSQAGEGKWLSKLPQVAKHYDFRGISTSYHFRLLRCCTKGVCRRLHRKKSITWISSVPRASAADPIGRDVRLQQDL